ncbi:MAG: sigma-70 family RNA polymerase sigma factor [Elusimicrobia bacterium]|nr:sigma-70 family RNA polymerase sigma factor [Elusimicrobiota bacterium]MBU2614567.1 sigma-70 family RNA polymerase sigma factor [Elusimicrobiota bacterium]
MIQETELIERAKTGDVEAFKDLIEAYQVKIYNFAYYLAKNEQDASDLSQEAWIKVFKQLPTFRLDSSFYTWCCKILKNLFIDIYTRRHSYRKELPLNDELDTKAVAIDSLHILEKEQRENIVSNAVTSLPDEFRMTIILTDMQGLSYEEVSKITKVSINTVRSRVSRGRERLRKIFTNVGTF